MTDRLSPEEVVLVRGWYEGRHLDDIAADLGLRRTAVALMVRYLRRRGHALTPRPTSSRAVRRRAGMA